ncbi:MAG: alpha/beta hydrolase [Planctomycetia bacterium]|nr:alpha/beta hydrolase [Planctomycetia bacterium]
MKRISTLFLTAVLLFVSSAMAQDKIEYKTALDVPYYTPEALAKADDYQKSQCRLDINWPANRKGFATLLWFHGGGLEVGKKFIPPAYKNLKEYKEGRLAIIGVGYRLSPKVTFPVFLEDAAAAVAWTVKNIDKYGGDPRLVFVSGGSAGAYLTAMIGMNPKWLAPYGLTGNDLAGLIPISGQMTTHFNVKKMLKMPGEQYQPIIDENAVLYWIKKDLPPIFLIMGDPNNEWPVRIQENQLALASLKALGHPMVEYMENPGFSHNRICTLATDIRQDMLDRMDNFISKATKKRQSQF